MLRERQIDGLVSSGSDTPPTTTVTTILLYCALMAIWIDKRLLMIFAFGNQAMEMELKLLPPADDIHLVH